MAATFFNVAFAISLLHILVHTPTRGHVPNGSVRRRRYLAGHSRGTHIQHLPIFYGPTSYSRWIGQSDLDHGQPSPFRRYPYFLLGHRTWLVLCGR